MSEREILRSLLSDQIKVLERSISNLTYSKQIIEQIDLEKTISEADLAQFDAFSSRFLRLYEVLLNQVIRTLLSLLKELENTHHRINFIIKSQYAALSKMQNKLLILIND